MQRSSALRLLAGGLALYGAYVAFGISQVHLTGVERCPTIGPVPACYLVFAGYLAMLFAMIRPINWLFLTGWIPVFLLAAAGVAGEIFSDAPVCPQTDGGIPKSYFSFGISLVLGFLGWMALWFKKGAK